MAIISGHAFFKDLARALDLKGPIRRVVLDASIDNAVRVYVEQLVNDKSSVQVVELLENTVRRCEIQEDKSLVVDASGIETKIEIQ